MPPLPPLAALREGFNTTIEKVGEMYAMIRSLVSGRVSPKNLGGPIMIFQAAYGSAQSSLTELIHFLGILSINLAVLNDPLVAPILTDAGVKLSKL